MPAPGGTPTVVDAPTGSTGSGTAAVLADRAAGWVRALPSRLPVLFLWTALVVCLSALLGVFTPAVVLPALAIVWAATWRLVARPVPAGRGATLGAGLALAVAVVWLLVNLGYASEVLLVQRDPGFLTLQAIWMAEHADPLIPLRSAADLAAAVPEVAVVSDAFWRAGEHMYAQGSKTFPGLLALAGWGFDRPGILAGNLVIGALALLALYDVARRLTTPLWGLLPVVALALSTPMLYFSRTPFTEPATMVLAFGGLAVLWGAMDGRRVWPFALSGAMVGAAALTRIDGAAGVSGLVLALGLVAGATRDPVRRRRLARGWAAATAAAGAMVVLGYLDVRVHSPGYLTDHASLYRPLIALLLASAAVGLVAIALGGRLAGWGARRGRALGGAAAVGILALCALLASRPLWMQRHGVVPGSDQASFVAAFQATAGVAVDGTRSYDEMTVVWLVWYLGLASVLLAVAGAALLLRASVVQRAAEPFVVLVALGTPALLYLVRPSITPDQVWAMRRLLPAALPWVLLCATWLLMTVRGASASRWSAGLAGAGAAAVVLSPLLTWGSLVGSTEFAGRAGQVDAMCEPLRGGRVVVLRGVDPPLLPTLRIMCDADVVELPAAVDRSVLARISSAWAGQVHVVAYTSGQPPWDTPATLTTALSRWPHSLRPASEPIRFDGRTWLGILAPDGSVEPAPTPAPAP